MTRHAYAGTGLLLAVAVFTSCSTMTAGTPVAEQGPVASTSVSPLTTTPNAEPPPPAPPSDDDQIREAVTAFQDAYNTQDWDGYRQAMCPAMREQFTGPVIETVQKTRTDQGPTNPTVTGVQVEGDTATATLDSDNEALGRRTVTRPWSAPTVGRSARSAELAGAS